MFSVVIPLYNKALRVKNTIQSVLDQTYEDFEIIIVNDGSTDKSLDIVKSIEDPRIRIIDKPNGGVSSARNRGIKEAKYEWICFLDADDLWSSNHLAEYYRVICKKKQINWIISSYRKVYNKKKNIEIIHKKSGHLDNVFDELLLGLSIHTSTVCLRKKLFVTYPDLLFTEGINRTEDREVWYKLCCVDSSPYYISSVLSEYNLCDLSSLTKNINESQKDDFLTLCSRVENFGPFQNLDVINSRKMISFINYHTLVSIRSMYIKYGLKPSYKPYINTFMWVLLKSTQNWPRMWKKAVSKFLFYFE